MEPLGSGIPRALWLAFWVSVIVTIGLAIAVSRRPPSTVQRPRGSWRAADGADTHDILFVGEGGVYSKNNEIATFARMRDGCIEIPQYSACKPFRYYPPDSFVVGSLRFHPVPQSLR